MDDVEFKKIRICTFNCNGIKDFQKRKDIFDFVRNQKGNIICLQETHLTYNQENFIRSSWGFNCYLAGSETNRNGVAILFNNNFDYKVYNVIRDVNGSYIVLDMELMHRRVTLINVYGPSIGDNPKFFDELDEYINQMGNESVIMGGDWNVLMNMKLDARNYTGVVYKPKSREKIIEIMGKYNLIDVWREVYPEKKGYTWRKFNTIKQGRLDYFLISDNLLLELHGVSVKESYRSDHSLVSVEFNTEVKKKNRQFWKFNNSLLRDNYFVDLVKKTILEVKMEYAALVYDRDNLINVPNEFVQFLINDQLFFEMLLLKIRGKTISYSTHKKKKENTKEQEVIKEIADLEKDLVQDKVAILEEKKRELLELRKARLEGSIVRSRAQWLKDGEKNSKYFCSLEKRNFIEKSCFFLQKEDGSIIFGEEDVLTYTKCFYENLYSFKDIQDVELNELVNEAPKLSEEEKQNLEGLLTLEK